MAAERINHSPIFDIAENYIYIYQLDKYLIIPTYPDTLNDTLGSTFASTNILARTAPIMSYSYSGPRRVAFDLKLHRDMIQSMNTTNLSFKSSKLLDIDDDYVDALVKYLQASALPSYKAPTNTSTKMVNPPMVAVRFGNQLFVKGIVSSEITVTYDSEGGITRDGKYQLMSLGFTIQEIDPQDAETLAQWGSFRGLEKVLTRDVTGGTL
jgi:hypothetical protein